MALNTQTIIGIFGLLIAIPPIVFAIMQYFAYARRRRVANLLPYLAPSEFPLLLGNVHISGLATRYLS